MNWVRDNLFGSKLDTVITVTMSAFIMYGLFLAVDWGIINANFLAVTGEECRQGAGACWAVVNRNFYLLLHGTFPSEERWRALLALVLLIIPLAAFLIPQARKMSVWASITILSVGLALMLATGAGIPSLNRIELDVVGGLLLTMILSMVALPLAFPLAVVLAIGRRSELPAISMLSTAYIELVRGLPMVVVLFLASVMLPLIAKGGLDFDKVVRAIIGITLFAAAYQAEVIRGGLQSVPRGQIEAGKALGLSSWNVQRYIVLPQAIRVVIPPMLGVFILFFKDTSLVSVIGLFELAGITSLIVSNPHWIGFSTETYIFIGLVYFSICYAMSKIAAYLERRMEFEAHD